MDDDAVGNATALRQQTAQGVASFIRQMLRSQPGIAEGQASGDAVLPRQGQYLTGGVATASDTAAAPETVLRRAVQRADIAPVVEIFPVGAVQGEKHPVQLVALEQAGEMIVCGLVVHMGNNSSFYQYSTRQGGKSSMMWGL